MIPNYQMFSAKGDLIESFFAETITLAKKYAKRVNKTHTVKRLKFGCDGRKIVLPDKFYINPHRMNKWTREKRAKALKERGIKN